MDCPTNIFLQTKHLLAIYNCSVWQTLKRVRIKRNSNNWSNIRHVQALFRIKENYFWRKLMSKASSALKHSDMITGSWYVWVALKDIPLRPFHNISDAKSEVGKGATAFKRSRVLVVDGAETLPQSDRAKSGFGSVSGNNMVLLAINASGRKPGIWKIV